jgi:hypothetical protein
LSIPGADYFQQILQRLSRSLQPVDFDPLPLHAPEPSLLPLGEIMDGAL